LTSLALSIVSNISERAQISGLAKFLKSSIVWCLGIVLTIFTCLLSLEGTLGASVDGLTSKSTKAVVTNFIPVVGKILGDTVETVIGCSNILKNTVGFIGVIIIIGIVLVPIIKIAVFTICFKLTASLGEAVADSKIIKLISEISENYQILLGILISASVMFIIGITLVLKISNSSLMYR
jgi:stage III sporulation protein AE